MVKTSNGDTKIRSHQAKVKMGIWDKKQSFFRDFFGNKNMLTFIYYKKAESAFRKAIQESGIARPTRVHVRVYNPFSEV